MNKPIVTKNNATIVLLTTPILVLSLLLFIGNNSVICPNGNCSSSSPDTDYKSGSAKCTRDDGQFIDWKTTPVDQLTPEQILGYFLWTNRSSCEITHDFGGFMIKPPTSMIDGQKAVCLDPAVRPPVDGRCLVYSFGINNEWSFDEMMETYGCKVHAFDPSMKMKSHMHSKGIRFHDIGLDDRDHVDPTTGWRLKSLSTIYQHLQHTGKVIDYLKLDIEFAEWRALPQILQSGMLKQVRQLHVEIHLRRNDSLQLLRSHAAVLKSIEDAGMIRFDSKSNPYYRGIISALNQHTELSLGYDIAWYQILPSTI